MRRDNRCDANWRFTRPVIRPVRARRNVRMCEDHGGRYVMAVLVATMDALLTNTDGRFVIVVDLTV